MSFGLLETGNIHLNPRLSMTRLNQAFWKRAPFHRPTLTRLSSLFRRDSSHTTKAPGIFGNRAESEVPAQLRRDIFLGSLILTRPSRPSGIEQGASNPILRLHCDWFPFSQYPLPFQIRNLEAIRKYDSFALLRQ